MSQNNDTAFSDLEELYAYGLNWLDSLELEAEKAHEEIQSLTSQLEKQNALLGKIRAALAAPMTDGE